MPIDPQQRLKKNILSILKLLNALDGTCEIGLFLAHVHVGIGIKEDIITPEYLKPLCKIGLLHFDEQKEAIFLTEKGKQYLQTHGEG